MLTVFIASFVFFLLAIAGMSLGYIVKIKPYKAVAEGSVHWGWRRSVIAQNLVIRAKAVGERGCT